MKYSLQCLVKKPRHKWFSAPDRRCDDGWYGPHNTIEAAVVECASNQWHESPIFVAQGYKITKADRDEWGDEFDWQVDVQNAIEVRLTNDKLSDPAHMTLGFQPGRDGRTPNDKAGAPGSALAWQCNLGNGEWDHDWQEKHDDAGEADGGPGDHWSRRECRVCGEIEAQNDQAQAQPATATPERK